MRRVLVPILFAHYLSAFTALGMPLFMPRILHQLAPGAPTALAALLYVLPSACTALTAAYWGRLADCFGRKLSLLRAQLGLAMGFLIAGFAPNLPWFILGLIVQGGCGGSMAAANAYLAAQNDRVSLSRALDLTQYSARLALISAPALLGLITAGGASQLLYRYLLILPLIAFALSLALPADPKRPAPTVAVQPTTSLVRASDGARWRQLLWTQFLLCFGTVVTFPYFLPYSQRLGMASDALAGLLYSLPHLVYLAAQPWTRYRGGGRARLAAGFALIALSGLWQARLATSASLIAARLGYGLGLWLAISGLNRALGHWSGHPAAGWLFGRFDACGKWAGAFSGLVAGWLVQRQGLAAPFYAAALAGVLGLALVLLVPRDEVCSHVNPPTI